MFLLVLLAVAATGVAPPISAAPEPPLFFPQTFEPQVLTDLVPTKSHVACVDGDAGGYPCRNVDLMSHLPLNTIGGGSGSDIWGWTHEATGREFGIMTRSNGTAFIEITDPENPVYLGNLPSNGGSSSWRDAKVYADHVFIVADFVNNHGLQVFHLDDLLDVTEPPVTFSPSGADNSFSFAHNIVINEDSGFAYVVGGNTCSGGLHVLDISTPDSPSFEGCFSDDGYTHDAQCVNYAGPDADYAGKEICFGSNTDTLTIIDVDDKAAMAQISRTGYEGVGYTHQGWLTDDQAYFLINDEVDENTFGHNTKTYIWDVRDLDAPLMIGTFFSTEDAVDHNLYIHNGYTYQANYTAGLRILTVADVATARLEEAAYFDTVPPGVSSSGAWSVYPYFASGNVVVSDISSGFFVLRPNLCEAPDSPTGLLAAAAGDNAIDLSWNDLKRTLSSTDLKHPGHGGHDGPSHGDPTTLGGTTIEIHRALGTCAAPGPFSLVASGVTGTTYQDAGISGQVDYAYQIRRVDSTGFCVSEASVCATATTTGACTAGPIFMGIESVSNLAASSCGLRVRWSPATANCGAGVTYNVYRSTDAGFVPGPRHLVAEGLTGIEWIDSGVEDGIEYFYAVRAVDIGNSVDDGNFTTLSGTPTGVLSNGTWSAGAELGDPGMIYENGANFAPKHIGWELSSTRVNTGDRSYFSTTGSTICVAMETPPLGLTAGQSPALSFETAYNIEEDYDGGVVQISVDGGAWQTLDVGYTDTFINSGDACGFSSGDPSFAGTSLSWSQHGADLSAFAGSEVVVRWIFSTDQAVHEEGWYVDDISITNAQVPGSCQGGGAFFSDGFETGDLSAWSSVVP